LSKRDELDVADALLANAAGDEAVEFRYADPFPPNPLDRTETLATVGAVRQWAEQTRSVRRARTVVRFT